jgi:hypothetical protein
MNLPEQPTKRYRVIGYAMIPAEYAVTIEAETEAKAIEIAQARWKNERGNWYQNNTEDTDAAEKWMPTAEEMEASHVR